MSNQNTQNNKANALKDYITVNERIEKFYEKYPDGRIIPEIVSWDNGVILMKATVYRNFEDTEPIAVGHAYEKEGSSFINKTSALENCETSAVGRALALAGFEIKKSICSKEEVENAKLQQKALEQKLESRKPSEAQIKRYNAVFRNMKEFYPNATEEKMFAHLDKNNEIEISKQKMLSDVSVYDIVCNYMNELIEKAKLKAQE